MIQILTTCDGTTQTLTQTGQVLLTWRILPTARAGCRNIPNPSQWEVVTKETCHPVEGEAVLISLLRISKHSVRESQEFPASMRFTNMKELYLLTSLFLSCELVSKKVLCIGLASQVL